MNLRDTIGVALVAGFLVSLGALFFKAIPESNGDLITYMLGQLSGFAAGIVAYHYTLTKTGEQATANTNEAFKAIQATAKARAGSDGGDAAEAAQIVADEAQIAADDVKRDAGT